eukprot:8747022-Alexandrium_andersonii.AAC.1
MSASLVGSEMCIRDSPPTPRSASGAPAGPFRCQTRHLREKGRRMHPAACLLYTSDAADDM